MIKNREMYYTTREVAEHVGFTASHVRRLIMQRKIKAEKIGNTWLVKKDAIAKVKRLRFPRDKE
jgi:excisionase family DNA binding protein